jgi:hypothetical protein
MTVMEAKEHLSAIFGNGRESRDTAKAVLEMVGDPKERRRERFITKLMRKLCPGAYKFANSGESDVAVSDLEVAGLVRILRRLGDISFSELIGMTTLLFNSMGQLRDYIDAVNKRGVFDKVHSWGDIEDRHLWWKGLIALDILGWMILAGRDSRAQYITHRGGESVSGLHRHSGFVRYPPSDDSVYELDVFGDEAGISDHAMDDDANHSAMSFSDDESVHDRDDHVVYIINE